jgi:hypothetical protein
MASITPFLHDGDNEPFAGEFRRDGGAEWWWLPDGLSDPSLWMAEALKQWSSLDPQRIPLGVLITGAARLMLGLVEHLVTQAGGSWVMCDTDSMFIVASPDGGTITDPQGRQIVALSYEKAEHLRLRFNELNPYNPEVTGPVDILQREYPKSLDGTVHACSISAKRYAMPKLTDKGSQFGFRLIRGRYWDRRY